MTVVMTAAKTAPALAELLQNNKQLMGGLQIIGDVTSDSSHVYFKVASPAGTMRGSTFNEITGVYDDTSADHVDTVTLTVGVA